MIQVRWVLSPCREEKAAFWLMCPVLSIVNVWIDCLRDARLNEIRISGLQGPGIGILPGEKVNKHTEVASLASSTFVHRLGTVGYYHPPLPF